MYLFEGRKGAGILIEIDRRDGRGGFAVDLIEKVAEAFSYSHLAICT